VFEAAARGEPGAFALPLEISTFVDTAVRD
jgi:hypothetical protein